MSYAPNTTLSEENLLHNLHVIRSVTRKSRVMVMLKANAYGHGIKTIATCLEQHVDCFGVARLDEAMLLRSVGIRTPMVVMQGVYTNDDFVIAAQHGLDLVIHEHTQLHCLQTNIPNKVNIWLKFDTGMGRSGFLPSEVGSIYNMLTKAKNVDKIRLMSHLACANDINHHLNNEQISVFHNTVKDLPVEKSLLNSAGIFNFGNICYDVVRPGIAIYGISPLDGVSAITLDLKPVMTLKAQVMSVRCLSAGSSIGYGRTFVCENDMIIATVAAGYGDGYPRSAMSGTPVLMQGMRCPIVGRVSMDMLTVDVTRCHGVGVGDTATLWGEKLPLEEVALYTHNVPYDILTAIQQRVQYHLKLHKF